MPKKTKKHKIHAKDRRKPLVLHIPISKETMIVSNTSRHLSTSKTGEISSILDKNTSIFNNDEQSTEIFKHDLTKSLIITSILILIQLGLFISAKNNYFDISSVIHFS